MAEVEAAVPATDESAMPACVKAVLCALGGPIVGAVRGVLQTVKTLMQTTVTALEAQLLILDILTLPITAAAAVAQGTVDTIRASVAVVPLEAIAECAAIGDVNQAVDEALQPVLADALGFLEQARRKAAFSDELRAKVRKLHADIDRLTAFNLEIAACAPSTPTT